MGKRGCRRRPPPAWGIVGVKVGTEDEVFGWPPGREERDRGTRSDIRE